MKNGSNFGLVACFGFMLFWQTQFCLCFSTMYAFKTQIYALELSEIGVERSPSIKANKIWAKKSFFF